MRGLLFMFYLYFSIAFLIILSIYLILKFKVFKDNENFKEKINKILKVISVVYCVIIFLSILLPDAFSLCYSKEELASRNVMFALVRWVSYVPFIVLPISVFFKNKTIKNIAIYGGLFVFVLNLIFYPQYLSYATDPIGRGLNSIPVLSEGFKNFLLNPIFRSFVFGITWLIQSLFSVVLFFEEYKDIKLNLKQTLMAVLVFFAIMIASIPIYVPQHLFGQSNIIFSAWSVPHLLWFVFVVCDILALYFIFRNKDEKTKHIVLLVLSLCLFIQYNQMFSAISINIKRLPLQLCNIGAYLILASMIFKNQKLFNFTLIVNLTGALFALAVPDLDNNGLFQLYNMHFILEHTNILVVPILALCFKIFKPVNIYALRDCLIGFCCYFVVVLLLGTMFNAIALKTSNDFYSANYLFMFDKTVATDIIKGIGPLFDITWEIGPNITLYPVIQLLIFLVFVVTCVLVYLLLRLIYFVNAKIKAKKEKIQN